MNETTNDIPLRFVHYLHFKNMSKTKPHEFAIWQTANVVTITSLKRFQLSTATDQAQPPAASMLHNERLNFPKETNQLLEIPLHAVPGRDALELRRVQRASGDDRVQVVRGC